MQLPHGGIIRSEGTMKPEDEQFVRSGLLVLDDHFHAVTLFLLFHQLLGRRRL